MYNRKSDKTKLKDKDYAFCTRCNSKEVADEIVTINVNDGSTSEAKLCKDCIKEEYPTLRKCECGADEGVSKVLCRDLDSGDKILVPLCVNCLETLADSSVYELIEENKEE